MGVGANNIGSEVAADVSMLKLTVYGNEHQGVVGLVDRVKKVETDSAETKETADEVMNQFKGAITTLKWIGATAIGIFTILASAVEIYRAMH